MRINFFLPTLNFSGGVKVVHQYADYLNKAGHEAVIVAPMKSVLRYGLNWNDYAVNHRWNPPKADISIATSWETAQRVFDLPDWYGKKVYFVQHYEIWDVWNSEECWGRLGCHLDPSKMVHIVSQNPKIRKMKERVDATYKLPLRKIVVSTWLQKVMKLMGEESTVVMNGVEIPKGLNKPCHTKPYLFALQKDLPWKGKINPTKIDNAFISYPKVWLKDEDLREHYRCADIFVYPSWVEGFGLPPLEAMAHGCAIVAYRVGAIPDYCRDQIDGFLSPPRWENDLYDWVKYLIDNPDDARMMGHAAREQAKRFPLEKACQEFERALLNL